MTLTAQQLWARFRKHYTEFPSIGLTLDISRMNFDDSFLETMQVPLHKAFMDMDALEKGAISNPDERRMVGHYWLRNPALAPAQSIRDEIERTVRAVKEFASTVHSGSVKAEKGKFTNLLVIGIGGSALGPQFVAAALGQSGRDKMRMFFFDNTDPDGMDRVLASIGNGLYRTLCVVISKSGGTKETRNGMVEAKAVFERAGLTFSKHAVAVTGEGSELDKLATSEGWLRRFPMWDWVGGRTSETSAVGLLPAALQGLDIEGLLDGAKACDEVTRVFELKRNPSAQLALMWYYVGRGKGLKDMVIIPYKDRLELFSRYLQQLIMESLGKELDLDKRVVNQGIAVYGNKGSTDQHAYVQQLREGINNFFVTFIQVLTDRQGPSMWVEPGTTSGDYLQGFLLGTRQALYDNGRESITIVIRDVSAFSVGVLIALYERAVGFYASLVNINAYHQPGVQAGKKAADQVLSLKRQVEDFLRANRSQAFTAPDMAAKLGAVDQVENIFHICERLSANPGRGVSRHPGKSPTDVQYQGS